MSSIFFFSKSLGWLLSMIHLNSILHIVVSNINTLKLNRKSKIVENRTSKIKDYNKEQTEARFT
jgi:hypothetical protein